MTDHKAGDTFMYGDREMTFRDTAEIADLVRQRDEAERAGRDSDVAAIRDKLRNTALL